MEAADLAGDDRTFEADFTGAGAVQLRERMREKLRELKDGAESVAVRWRHSIPPRPASPAVRWVRACVWLGA
jgi:hypothetical protein